MTISINVVALLLCSLFGACVAKSTPLTFTFTGEVTDDAINGCGVVVECGALMGSLRFDTAAIDQVVDPGQGLYAGTELTLSVNGALFFSATDVATSILDSPSVDQFGLLASGIAGNLSQTVASILLSDFTASAFGSDDLPLNGSGLAPLLPGSFQLNADDDSFQLLGVISNVASAPVPEPSSALLFVLGISLLASRFAGLTSIRRKSL